VSTGAVRALQSHSWPGNIRELENVIHFALLMNRTGMLETEDLRLSRAVGAPADATGASRDGEPMHELRAALQRLVERDLAPALYETVERLLLSTAFKHCGGNQVRTARCLGVSRNVVRAQLKRFNLISCETESPMDESAVALA
jgi:DNA-binding NtrC family response regulator